MITRTSKLPNRLLVISFVVLCGAASVAGWSLSARFSQGEQRRQRVIDKIFTRSAPVVEIEEVKVSQNTVKLGSSFEEDNDSAGGDFTVGEDLLGQGVQRQLVRIKDDGRYELFFEVIQ